MVAMTVFAGLSLALNGWLVWLLVRQAGLVTVKPSTFRRVSRETPRFRAPLPAEEEEPEPPEPQFDRKAVREKLRQRYPGKTDAEYDAAVAEIESHGGRMLATLR